MPDMIERAYKMSMSIGMRAWCFTMYGTVVNACYD